MGPPDDGVGDTGRYLMGRPTAMDWLKSLPLYVLPHHGVSRLIHRLTRSEAAWLRRPLTRWFIKRFRVNMEEALIPDPDDYATFNQFFTRLLKPDARPGPADASAVTSPADGALSAAGTIHDDRVIQAKGHDYSLITLLGGTPERAAPFQGGTFATIYLSPKDYHRVHMPRTGTLREMAHIPGRLFSVGRHTVRTIPGLFARNERVVSIFDTAQGPMAIVLVGAINVASIETVWAGEVTPPRGRRVRTWDYPDSAIRLERGAEMGRFNMGSTVILVFPPGVVGWDSSLAADTPLRVHQAIGRTRQA